jgi:hypothetical protein
MNESRERLRFLVARIDCIWQTQFVVRTFGNAGKEADHACQRMCFRHAPIEPRKSERKQQVARERSKTLLTRTSYIPYLARGRQQVPFKPGDGAHAERIATEVWRVGQAYQRKPP